MTYAVALRNVSTNSNFDLGVFAELDDALEEAGIFWRGTFPAEITVTSADGVVFAKFGTTF